MNIIGPLVQITQQLRIFHWQTPSYSAHKAFGKTYDTVSDLIDTFIETYMGVYGRAKPTVTYNIELKSLVNDEVVNNVLNEFIVYLKSMSEEIESTDLLNIRDSILGEINTLKYLLTLS